MANKIKELESKAAEKIGSWQNNIALFAVSIQVNELNAKVDAIAADYVTDSEWLCDGPQVRPRRRHGHIGEG